MGPSLSLAPFMQLHHGVLDPLLVLLILLDLLPSRLSSSSSSCCHTLLRFALAITSGFRDLLHIGNQSRPAIFDLEVRKPEVLYQEVVEVDERVLLLQGEESAADTADGERQ